MVMEVKGTEFKKIMSSCKILIMLTLNRLIMKNLKSSNWKKCNTIKAICPAVPQSKEAELKICSINKNMERHPFSKREIQNIDRDYWVSVTKTNWMRIFIRTTTTIQNNLRKIFIFKDNWNLKSILTSKGTQYLTRTF